MPSHPEAPRASRRTTPLAPCDRLLGRAAARRLALTAALALAVTAAVAIPAEADGLTSGGPASGGSRASAPASVAAPWAATLAPEPACGQAPAGSVTCQAIVDTGLHWTGHDWATGPAPASRPRTSPSARTSAASAPAPYMAAALQSAYKLPSSRLGSRQTIAIVDAYDDPNAASDLAAYRAANHLPACDAAFPCFEKVNQDGQQGNYPSPDTDWSVEESLDLDMASAICPSCRIILVEANSNLNGDMYAAEDEAARLGANVISDSWAEDEYAGEQHDARYFDHPGIAITAAAGDSGYGAVVPAAFATVTAVGGTSLYRAGSARGWAEQPWEYTGSGCSAYMPKPAWQTDRLCGMRTVADVSAVADPDTPVAVYDTNNESGWLAVGGTSVATPVIAGVYALAGNAATAGPGASYAYAHRRDLFDVTSGTPFYAGGSSNGDCGGDYLCTGTAGYDGPTGLGTPDGIGAF
jgi:hypothetical protein